MTYPAAPGAGYTDGTTTGEDLLTSGNSGYPAAPGGAYQNESADESDSSGGDEEIPLMDASGMPFRFNPPLHTSARFIRADLGSDDPKATNRTIYRESQIEFAEDAATRGEFLGPNRKDPSYFEKLRLGRIVHGDKVLSAAMMKSHQRYGIRFLYNPTSLAGGMTVSTNFIPSQQSSGSFVLQQGLESINFEILLNRIPDVQGKAFANEYGPTPISNYDRKQIQERGTHYDIDFLYRVANGVHDLRSRSETGDIGLLLPNPCNLILGKTTTRGAITSIKVDDQLFSRDMVPILSYVQITFTRFLSTRDSETTRLASSGIKREDSSGEDPEVEGDITAYPDNKSLTGRQVYQLARDAGFSPSLADIMTQIAWMESSWRPNRVNRVAPDLSYGLWQINMINKLGPDRRKKYGLKKNTDLLDPQTNARVARAIYKDERPHHSFDKWTTYTNGSYKRVKRTWR